MPKGLQAGVAAKFHSYDVATGMREKRSSSIHTHFNASPVAIDGKIYDPADNMMLDVYDLGAAH
jgi:hypothetical protein